MGGPARAALARVSSLAGFDAELAAMRERLPEFVPYPGGVVEGPRGRAGAPRRPHLPEGWLDSPHLTQAQRAELLAYMAYFCRINF